MSLHRKLNERERMAYASVARLERERDDLRAQLAQRNALLGAIAGWTTETRAAVLEAFQDELNESASYAWYDAAIADLMKLVEALSASAEPSAPIPKSECPHCLGERMFGCTQCQPDELCDLATWKRRAIEAESKLRTYDPRIVEMSAQAMDALLTEPKPEALVLTKCKLCDQLQADLTARDKQLDRLRAQND